MITVIGIYLGLLGLLSGVITIGLGVEPPNLDMRDAVLTNTFAFNSVVLLGLGGALIFA